MLRRLALPAVALVAALGVGGCVSSSDYVDRCRADIEQWQTSDDVSECASHRARQENDRRAGAWASLLFLPVAILAVGAAYAPPVATCTTNSRPRGDGWRTTTTCAGW